MKIMRVLFIVLLSALSGCSMMQAQEDGTFTGNYYASTTNSISAIYCWPSTAVKDYESQPDYVQWNQIIFSPFILVIIVAESVIDLGLSFVSDTISLPYDLASESTEQRSEITNCDEGVYYNGIWSNE